jgi:DNA-binding MarR family transcriptional regulator/GNAT superfamily N-acetyltransferase
VSEIAAIRRFNRTVTQSVGALDEQYLARGRPLGASRVLWEIGLEGGEVRMLRSRLGLDSGQLSRLLRALEAEGLVTVAPSPVDRRIRVARLTRAGVRERAVLDERSDALAASMLDSVPVHKRDALVVAMDTVDRLLTGAAIRVEIADPAGDVARACLRAYFAELDRRGEHGFDPAAAISAEPHELRLPAGAFLLATLRGEAVGCGAVKLHDGAACEIKRMWVAESARGLGLGRQLLVELERVAMEHGATVAHIETNHVLVEAMELYRSAGYVEVAAFNAEPFADHWFEKKLHKSSRELLA